jgi:cation:H+ antiporter
MLWLSFLLLIVGMALVIKGADWLIDGASSLAKKFDIPEIVIGLTVVAFGTSAPELAVNIFSSIGHHNEMVLGNIIGSNIFNTLLILSIAALIYPLSVKKNTVWKEIPFSAAVVVVFLVMANDGFFFHGAVNQISRLDGIILLFLFVCFITYTFFISKIKSDELFDVRLFSTTMTVILILLGIGGLFGGGRLVIYEAEKIARALGVSEKLIGLTILSAGTSLPELVTSARAAWKKRCDMAVGNVVGSNIFNLLLVMGVSSLIAPVGYNTVLNIDTLVFASAAVFLFITMFTGRRRRLDRWEAVILLLVYVAYMGYIFIRR